MPPLSRRTMLRGAGGVAFVGASAAVLPVFGTPSRTQDPAQCTAPQSNDGKFVVSNWVAYIDPDTKKGTSTMTDFEEKFKVTVDYTEDVNDNIEFYAKIRNQIGSCQDTGRDMFMLTDWMAGRMIQLGWIQPMDPTRVPNLHANIISSLKSPDWDPDRLYSAPWQAGFTGICYNKAEVGEVRTMDELLTRADLKGRVTLLSEMRDTMGLLMLSDGADPANFSDADWSAAMAKLETSVGSGQVRAFTGNDYLEDLNAGNVVACIAWSGDIMNEGNPDFEFIVPEEGMMQWADNMLIPNLSSHVATGEDWVNYYFDPEIAARLAAWNYYVCPVEGAKEAMESIDPSAVDEPLIFPTEEYLANTHLFMALEEYKNRDYGREWSDVTGA